MSQEHLVRELRLKADNAEKRAQAATQRADVLYSRIRKAIEALEREDDSSAYDAICILEGEQG